MVPATGAISNSEINLIAEREGKDTGFIPEHKTPLNSKTCEELFNTLAEWNSYLEDHIPYFSEGETTPEDFQP
ncbi:hypothetical protein MNBD_CHLOROFLEXI01-3692 [hydrothermal vent metagenome]|uniref:Uncharacterized protein n=1 Tax=hydrothermal vent metagenome TaxID=652676 RepID=A0A3B0UYH8_9ZZZZ